jgi:putative membrane protein
MIIPTNYTGFTAMNFVMCGVLCLAGIVLGAWMSRLEEQYK